MYERRSFILATLVKWGYCCSVIGINITMNAVKVSTCTYREPVYENIFVA
jgi:hypothetical protein